MSDLTQVVLDQLDQPHIDAIAAQFGIDSGQAAGAIGQAVSLMMGGLARNAATDDGATALHGALGDHAGSDLGSLLGGILGGGGIDGNSILGHVFGSRQGQAAQGLGQSTGLGADNAGQLLALLAPIVMSVLGRMSQNQGMSAGGLAGVLGQEAQRIGQGGAGRLLGVVLDRDGDGQVGLGDLLKIGEGLLGAQTRRV